MPFKITIERTTTETVVKPGPFAVIARVPWTDDDLNGASPAFYGRNDFRDKEPLKEVRGYAPDREVSETKSEQIFQQTVEDLDMPAVIMAINKLQTARQL